MNNDNDDIVQDLITRLNQLQVEQTELLVRLERQQRRDRERAGALPVAREFAIGDRVRIRNPNRHQATRGTITKIGTTRITVTSLCGREKVIREPKNLVLER
jgi:hypothetical protein